ncbi:SWIM zinc finger family protein [Nocardioides sp. Soil805]|uniref:SWIM zinc finger family protein n=1 Tax=Nocardioides sp. Soil805 TaxID=1736416 RepID=UPI0009E6C293|nr:SWIM zinc finger family protein [Nocardioides sp. Soil805]
MAGGRVSGYGAASALVDGPQGRRLGLETASALTPTGLVERPVFFSGFPARPEVLAAGLLAVADVAATTYADFGQAKRLANLDPVVTASGDRLRFESFSGCNSVHARLDVLPDGVGEGDVGFGTTNVDINQPLRTALARMGSTTLLHLTVGPDEVRTSTPDDHHVERKVELPDRWVRGLAEVPYVSAAMTARAELTGGAIGRFARDLPRAGSPGPTVWAVPSPSGLRLLPWALPGSIEVPGVTRLRGMDRVLRFATSLTLHADAHGATAWVFELPGARLTLALTAHPYRGFSGEGGLLLRLVDRSSETHGRALLADLGWDPVVDPQRLAATTGRSGDDVTDGLAWLAASGRLGHDLAEGAWFHRELPIDAEQVLRRNPRLRHALALAESGGVRPHGAGRWLVRGSGTEHAVSGPSGDGLTCTCPWADSHAAGRGPCKHVLAVVVATSG